jgi:hypothetical protein
MIQRENTQKNRGSDSNSLPLRELIYLYYKKIM